MTARVVDALVLPIRIPITAGPAAEHQVDELHEGPSQAAVCKSPVLPRRGLDGWQPYRWQWRYLAPLAVAYATWSQQVDHERQSLSKRVSVGVCTKAACLDYRWHVRVADLAVAVVIILARSGSSMVVC
eukprot:scaffold1163_cov362-Prasinococcus_capsulatus_cf.AAC.2